LSQCEKRLIDLNRLLLTLSLHICETLTLRPSQVDQLELANNYIIRVRGIYLLQRNCKNRVRPARRQVHLVRPNGLVLDPLMKKLHDVLVSLALECEQVLHEVVVQVVPLKLETERVILRCLDMRGLLLLSQCCS
jgi:hypothetical protein